MFKVDIHTHILPPEIPKFKDKFGYGGFIELHHHANCCGADMVDGSGKFFRAIEPNCYEGEPRIKDCDHHFNAINGFDFVALEAPDQQMETVGTQIKRCVQIRRQCLAP